MQVIDEPGGSDVTVLGRTRSVTVLEGGRRKRDLLAASRRRWPLLTLAVLLAVLVVSAYSPFDWDPPRMVNNTVTREADGSLTFGTMNRARTVGRPSWLGNVRRGGRLAVHLVVLPRFAQAQSPTAVMMLARDYMNTDFCLAQDRSALAVYLRRPGSNANGDPALQVADVFRPGHWSDVEMDLGNGRLRVRVDGEERVDRPVPLAAIRLWKGGRLALGGEVNGGGNWQGAIRTATVSTPGGSVDYLAPGVLQTPRTFLELTDHVMSFPPPSSLEWAILVLHFVTFVPVGYLLVFVRRPPMRVSAATLVAVGVALAMAVVKFMFPRHTAIADVVVQSLGALVGASLAWLSASVRAAGPASVRPDHWRHVGGREGQW